MGYLFGGKSLSAKQSRLYAALLSGSALALVPNAAMAQDGETGEDGVAEGETRIVVTGIRTSLWSK